jgi:tetratricopeptide (TPR) repeat protein/nucleotide-binding universal stress UspA family protein
MNMSKKLFLPLALVCAATLLPARVAAQAQAGRDTIIVLPFENTTNQREYNWVGASFADSLAELFAHAPGLGVVSTDERELLYQRLRLPLTSSPSRATAIKIAREAKATLVVIGTYSVKSPEAKEGGDDKEDKVAPLEVSGTASVVRVNEGKLWRKFDFGGAVTNLQRTQGTLAYQILYLRDDALTISLNRVLELATRVPPRAFESLVKGIMTDDPEKRSAYLQNAGREFTKAHPGEIYPEAEFELGNLYYQQEKWKDAAEHFAKLKKGDAHYAEAAFYGGLTHWRLNDLKSALAMLVPLTTDMPLTGVYNNAGAISLQAARGEKPGDEHDRLLKQATDFLSRARETEPQDATVLYNYAYALFLSNKFAEAADQLRNVLTLKPRDGEVLFLYAKALERAGQTEAATAADNEARRYLKPYAQYQTEWQKSQTINSVPPRLAARFDVAHAIEIETKPAQTSTAAAQDLLERARKLYVAGQDDELLPELNRVLMIEPMNAEAHLYVGRVYQRRGDLPRAVASLKAALFWDAKLIDAHILLGRIFLEQGDRAQAMVHARTAIQLDPNNQEAIALFRQVETGAK